MSETISEKKQSTRTQAIEKVKDELMALPDCNPTYTSLNINPGIVEERLEKIGKFLFTLKRKGTLQFWLGEWCIFCEDNNRAPNLLHSFYNYYSDRTIKNIAWVCRKVEPSRRRANLSFAHHQVVAPLTPEEQVFWLKETERMGWAVKELRRRKSEHYLLAEKGENKEDNFICISTNEDAYNYSGYIKRLNRSVKKLTNKLKLLLEYKPYPGFSEKIKPQFCNTDEEREFSKNCSRLFWNLEWLLDEQLSKLTLFKGVCDSTQPLELTDVVDYHNGIGNPDLLRFVDFWEHARSESTLFRFHACFAICSRLAEMLNTEVRHLIRYSKEYFADCYDSDYERQREFIKEIVGRFRYKCSALRSHLDDLEKTFNEHVPEPIDEEIEEEMKKYMFDSCTEKEKSMSTEPKEQSENKDMEKELYELMKDI
ncbi:MAG: hypothetical protein WBE11_15855 [Candidatus Aminicenantaceae bacterium]